MNTGYIPTHITEDHCVLGSSSVPKKILEPEMNWLKWLPDFEPQSKQFETYNCTTFNTLNPIEILLRRLGVDENYSDRWTGIKAGTYPPGNDPQKVCEAIRQYGLIPEFMLPFSEDLKDVDEYYSFKGSNVEACAKKGKEWLARWDFKHEWVDGTPEAMMEALQYSPLSVGVNAWVKEGNYYVRKGVDNHWTSCVVACVPQKSWIILDTYINDGTPLKTLPWDYKFTHIKRFSITEKQVTQEELKLFERILLILKQWISKLN